MCCIKQVGLDPQYIFSSSTGKKKALLMKEAVNCHFMVPEIV